ncbi:hypothetical protein BGZ95_003326 [Linnemannia exigua]|uniref:HMG box domain-containing protein n=1 Tax=Linnemannia exigua TaxID=604196 RepID=A0AAD4D4C0_9FUNG|nr:hypothetical protein BGZ95_003326 [Linnemannia exigua]
MASPSSSSASTWAESKRLPAPSVPGGGCFALATPRLNLATKPPPGSMIEFSLQTLETANAQQGKDQTNAAGGMEHDVRAGSSSMPSPPSQSYSFQTPLTSSSSSPSQRQDQQQQQLPAILNSYMLYRKDVYAKNFALFKAMRASGATISRAISLAWKNEPEIVKRKFEYEAELERVRQQGQVQVGYEYRKRKSDTMTAGGNGKGKASASSTSTTTSKAKNKNSKSTKCTATTKSSSSASGSGSGSGSGRMIRKVDFLGSSSLGFGLGSLALSSSMSLSSSSSSPRLGFVPERMELGSDPKRNNSAEGSHSSAIQPGSDLAALILSASGEQHPHGRSGNSNIGRHAKGQARRTKSSASTTAAIAATAAAAVAKTRQRSKSEGGTYNPDLGNVFQDENRARLRPYHVSDHSHKQIVVQVTTIDIFVTFFTVTVAPNREHQPHLRLDEGREGADDDDNNIQDEEDIALREDRVLKRRKSFLDHHQK